MRGMLKGLPKAVVCLSLGLRAATGQADPAPPSPDGESPGLRALTETRVPTPRTYGLDLAVETDTPLVRPEPEVPVPTTTAAGLPSASAAGFEATRENSVIPLVTLVGGYRLSRSVSLIATAGTFGKEPLDPTFGVLAHTKLAAGLLGYASLTAAAPISSEAWLAGRATTVTAMLSPTYHYRRFSLGLAGSYSYDVYTTSPDPYTQPDAAWARYYSEENAASGALSADYALTRRIDFGVGGESRRAILNDGESLWTIRETLARLELALPSHVTASAAYALINGLDGTPTPVAPRLPVLSLTIGLSVGNANVTAGADGP